MAEDLPFKTEYAKSGRSSCRGCKLSISKDSLRLAKIVQSQHFDGKQPTWFHYGCFFKKNKPKQLADIAGFDRLRWEDQEKIKQHFSGSSAVSSAPASVDEVDAQLSDYQVDYAKSNRSKCKVCEDKISKEELRIAIMVDGDSKFTGGKIPAWHHISCFVEKKESEREHANVSEQIIAGFKSLTDEDKKKLRKVLGLKKTRKRAIDQTKDENKNGKIVKPSSEDVALKKQSNMLWKLRDDLQKNCSVSCLRELLNENQMSSTGGESNLLERCADAISFGVPGKCPECSDGSLLFTSRGYQCTGHLTAWTKCQYVTFKPERLVWTTSPNFKEDCEYLKKLKPQVRERIFPKSMDVLDPDKPLAGKKILLSSTLKKSKKEAADKIADLGGVVVKDFSNGLFCYVSTEEELQKGSKKVEQSINKSVPIVSNKFLFDIKRGRIEETVRKFELVPTKAKLDSVDSAGAKRRADKTLGSSTSAKVAKLTLKGGAVVDPLSEKDDCCHVYENNSGVYNAVLGMVDLAKGTNSYYKAQLLAHDSKKEFYLFRSWGRVGTKIGKTKCQTFYSLTEATEKFTDLFEEKTGNVWSKRKNFIKHPYKFYPIEIDYGQEDDKLKKLQMEVGESSKLALEVQKLIKMIFDVESMKKTMAEFEIDLNKMPLGKLSKKQIEKAYKVLGELQKYMENEDSNVKILDASNRFYTLIPHDFGLKTPPLLNEAELIKSKMDMLESLLDIEVAYSLLKGSVTDEKDPIDVHYESLKARIEVLDKKTEEFELINDYVKNTHAKTHTSYTLQLSDVFKLDRDGEESRYSPFRDLHNRKLLWHGSRTSNYAGIISQGLRIAPPEAPVTGYMFGKGIYFADMVSKSANYCHTSSANPTGLMLLCEVALGNMYELEHAKAIDKLPKGKHSCKGVGRTGPNPESDHVLPDGVLVPIGEGIDEAAKKSSLLYNEYIVYDIAQVRMKYLLKLDFKYKY